MPRQLETTSQIPCDRTRAPRSQTRKTRGTTALLTPRGRGCRPQVRGQREDANDPEDLHQQEMTAADRFLSKVYGDSVHRNNGRHLHGGIPAVDDKAMCRLYDQVVSHRHSLFQPPDGASRQDVILMWADELCGCREGRHNA